MSNLREKFEAWTKSNSIQDTEELLVRSRREPDKYVNPILESEWQAFQAGYDAYQKQLQAEREAYSQHCDNRILRNRIQ